MYICKMPFLCCPCVCQYLSQINAKHIRYEYTNIVNKDEPFYVVKLTSISTYSLNADQYILKIFLSSLWGKKKKRQTPPCHQWVMLDHRIVKDSQNTLYITDECTKKDLDCSNMHFCTPKNIKFGFHFSCRQLKKQKKNRTHTKL